MKKRFLSLLLCLSMAATFIPTAAFAAGTGTNTGSDMDALTALGIDSSAPKGFDPNSTENPFGKNTVTISPVYELYKIGLTNGTGYDATYSGTGTLQNGSDAESHNRKYDNSLKSTLYGHEKWSAETAAAIMGSGDANTIASGQTTATGSYTKISTGTVNDATAANIPYHGYLKDAGNATTDLGSDFEYALSQVATGNFTGSKDGLLAQTVMVYTSDLSSNGGLSLRFGDAASGAYGTSAKTLLPTTTQIGNPTLKYGDKLVENFAEAPYQLQNYLQVATGDWNGDGLDEVAVYIPEVGKSRIVVYALQLTGSDNKETAYQNPAKWSAVWTYYLSEGDVVSNMVSLTSGDVNKDGLDDLAGTWGYYYGPDQNKGSRAVVMFGAKGTSLFTESQEFDLSYNNSKIVRASFAFGDMSGSSSSGKNADVLILCGQSDADLKDGNTQTRYVALYDWNGKAFVSNVHQNFNLFAKDDGKYVWQAMSRSNDIFYSLPLCTANTAVVSQAAGKGGDLLYFDSLIIEYTDKGLTIQKAWDNQPVMQGSGGLVQYVEYGATAGDLTGQNGAGTLFTMTQTLSSTVQENLTPAYTATGTQVVPVYTRDYYYKNWFYKLFGIKTWYSYVSGTTTETTTKAVNASYEKLTLGSVYMVAANPSENYQNRSSADFSTAICLANTDKDSSYMNYSGKHYYTYTDPEVLAVLASPPYFSDLMDRDDLSGNYAESTTTYSKTEGSSSGSSVSATISIGAYVAYEQDIQVFGVTVASFEAEAAIIGHFTFDTEKTSTLEQTVTYSAAAGEDRVAFYSIPMEIYEYTSYVPDGTGGYKEVLTTVNIPHEAAIRLLSLDEYESIAKDYRVLPTIAENALTHTVGDPSTYPTRSDGYRVIAEYTGTPAAVGFSSTEGGSGISQEIAMSTEKSTAFSASAEVEAKVGGGAGGFKVGVIAGAEIGAGMVTISTSGSSFSGEMQDMPIEAQAYNYGLNWRIFCYQYTNGGRSFPVVSYIVSGISKPPSLPGDFRQDISNTTDDSATLTWSYDQTVAGFNLYRYYEFPDGSGSYEIAYIPFSQAVRYDQTTGTYYFSYTDKGLSPYTEYFYQIQTLRGGAPTKSIYSEPMSCRTKTTVGYPSITISGLNEQSGYLPIYPDADSTATATVANPSSYKSLSYQWQKLTDGSWKDLSGKTDAGLTISNAGAADDSSYRCRVNAIYYDTSTATNYYISAYSDAFQTAYSKRTPGGNLTALENVTTGSGGITLDGLTAGITLYSTNKDHSVAPTGNVTFTVTGTDYKYNETKPLAVSSATDDLGGAQRYYSTASLNIASLPAGVYTVSAYYSGSKVFKDMETASNVLVVVGNGSAYRLSLSAAETGSSVTKFTYGDNIYPLLEKISKDLENKVQVTPVSGVSYEIEGGTAFTSGSLTPNVGSYTMQAKVGTEVVTSLGFSVSKKPVTISVANQNNVSAGAAVEEHPPVIESAGLTADQLAALKLSYTAVNSAGNITTLNQETEPGKYTVTACVTTATPGVLYNNYDVTYVPGSYTIVGATYRLTVKAANYTDSSGTRPVGTAGISSASQDYADYTAGTTVVLYATPQDGYQVDTWTAKFNTDGATKTQKGETIYTFTTEAQPVNVTVTFKPAEIRLFTVAQPEAGGTVTCSDQYFSSGAYVSHGAEYDFTAVPAAGYHFSKWQTVSGGTTTTPSGTPGAGGSSSLKVTVGKASMTVYAIFERDAYTLTLSGDIEAYYMYDDDGVSSTDPIKRMVASGGSVPGDTKITVEPKIGYQAAKNASFIVNGAATADLASHTFTIAENTAISLETVRNVYAVTVSAENGSVKSTVNGITATDADLAAVSGGKALAFTAHADRGYVFDHWTVTKGGESKDYSTKTLTIAALGNNLDVTAVFKKNAAYTLNAAVSSPSRGVMNYTLYDIYGDPVKENETMPAEGLPVYKGESAVLSVAVKTGSMMEQWAVNGKNTYTTQKTYTINEIDGDINATAYLKAASSYAVHFVKMGETSSKLVAKVDGSEITSGDLQFGGSALQFSATPENAYMVDHWTVTKGDLTAAEGAKIKDSDGNLIVDPTYIIDPLMQNSAVRVHFTALVTNPVTLPDTSEMGQSTITYVTPISPTDISSPDSTTEEVRVGGTVCMTLKPNNGYGTSVQRLKALLEDAANDDANISVEKTGDLYTATIRNLTQALTLTEQEIYVQAQEYTITVPTHVTASVPKAIPGDTVTLTVSPATGYALSALSLDNGTLKEAVSASRLTYTFTMPDGDVTVKATFVSTSSGDGGGGGGGGALIPTDKSGQIPVGDLSKPGAQETVTIQSKFASVAAPSNMLTGIAGISGTNAEIKVAEGDKSTLSAQAKETIGDRPLISLQLFIDGLQTNWSNPGAPVTVSIPYQPTAAELNHPGSIVVWYIDGSGNLNCVPSGYYDAATGRVIFTTTHFSDYAVGYNQVSFRDVTADAWYYQSVSFIAARGITTGMGDGSYSPDAQLTRGQFIVMLMKAYGLDPDVNATNNFLDAGNTYYTGYLAAAKRLGISNGMGDNLYMPENQISRQEMFTLLYNALKINGQLPDGTSDKVLTSFNDAGQIAPWAKDAMTLLVQSGIVSGSNGTLKPADTTTRAEMAQVLYNLLEK